jgi:alpha-ketoglutarate-dependent taurine dioxygenase
VEKFRDFSVALSPKLDNYDEQTSPRKVLDDHIFTSTEHPADQYILFHNANSYSHFWPMKIWFGCIIKSEEGGRTPVADCRRILSSLPPELVERFEREKILYVRNFMPGMGLPWQQTFNTDDPRAVEEYCRQSKIDFEWVGENHLRTRQVRHAVARHPVTGERVWFNQAHLFHVSTLEPSLAKRFREAFAEEDLPSNSYYGDGAQIEQGTLDAILEAYDKSSLNFDWEVGDVMLLDNMLTCHSRTPYRGKRLITVAFSGRRYNLADDEE